MIPTSPASPAANRHSFERMMVKRGVATLKRGDVMETLEGRHGLIKSFYEERFQKMKCLQKVGGIVSVVALIALALFFLFKMTMNSTIGASVVYGFDSTEAVAFYSLIGSIGGGGGVTYAVGACRERMYRAKPLDGEQIGQMLGGIRARVHEVYQVVGETLSSSNTNRDRDVLYPRFGEGTPSPKSSPRSEARRVHIDGFGDEWQLVRRRQQRFESHMQQAARSSPGNGQMPATPPTEASQYVVVSRQQVMPQMSYMAVPQHPQQQPLIRFAHSSPNPSNFAPQLSVTPARPQPASPPPPAYRIPVAVPAGVRRTVASPRQPAAAIPADAHSPVLPSPDASVAGDDVMQASEEWVVQHVTTSMIDAAEGEPTAGGGGAAAGSGGRGDPQQ